VFWRGFRRFLHLQTKSANSEKIVRLRDLGGPRNRGKREIWVGPGTEGKERSGWAKKQETEGKWRPRSGTSKLQLARGSCGAKAPCRRAPIGWRFVGCLPARMLTVFVFVLVACLCACLCRFSCPGSCVFVVLHLVWQTVCVACKCKQDVLSSSSRHDLM